MANAQITLLGATGQVTTTTINNGGANTVANSLNAAIGTANTPTATDGVLAVSLTETVAPTPIVTTAGTFSIDGGGFTLGGLSTSPALIVGSATVSGATLDIGNISIVGAGGAISLVNAAIVNFLQSGTSTNLGTISGAITGAGSIVVGATVGGTYGGSTALADTAGSTLVLAGANTYTGTTTINDTLVLGASGTLGAGAVTDNTGGVLDISGSQSTTGVTALTLTGAGGVTLGTNRLVLTTTGTAADTTYTGTISGVGSVQIGTASSPGIYTLGAQTYTGSTVIYGALTLTAGATTASSNFSLKQSGASLTTGTATVINELTGVAGSKVILGSNTLTVKENLVAATFSGVISGTTGNLVVQGPYALSLAGVNTYTGTTTISPAGGGVSAGILNIVGAGSIIASTSVVDNGTLNIAGASGGSVGITALSGSGGVILGSNKLILSSTAPTSFGGVISGAGAVQFGTVSTTGTLSSPAVTGLAAAYTFSNAAAAQKYTGSTIIYGSLTLGVTNDIITSSNVALKQTGATLVTGFNQAINELTGVSGSVVTITGSTTLTINETVTNASYSGSFGTSTASTAGALTFAQAPYTFTFAGTDYDTGKVNINTGASVTLTTAGAFAAVTAGIVDNGTLNVSAAAQTFKAFTGTGALVIGAPGVTLTSNGTSASTFNGVISGAGGVTIVGAANNQANAQQTYTLGADFGETALTGANTYTGTTTISAAAKLSLSGSLASSNIVLTANTSATGYNGSLYIGASTTYAGVISGSGLVNINAATLTLTGANTLVGTVNVSSQGTLVLGSGGSLTSATVTGAGVVNLSGATSPVSIANLNGSGSVILGSNTLTITGTNAGSVNPFSNSATASLGITGVISGAGGLQIGAVAASSRATVTIAGAETYTGSTVVYNTLLLSGTASLASSNVSLKSGTVAGVASTGLLDISTETTTVTINTLTGVAGTGVALGANTLDVIENTAATFSGVIGAVGSTAGATGGLIVDAASTATLTLAGTNIYTGVTAVNGSLTLTGTIANSGTVTIGSAGTLTLGANETLNNLSGGGTLNLGSFTAKDAITGVGHSTLSSTISGTGSLTESGAVTAGLGTAFAAGTTSLLTLTHAGNTFSGGITIAGGGVEVAAAGAAGTGTITFADVTANGATGTGYLQIDNAALTGAGTATESFSNTIANVSAFDVIDLSGLSWGGNNAVTVSGNTLTITENGVAVALTIGSATVVGTAFHALEDSHGGTYIVGDIGQTGVAASATYNATHFHP